MKTKENIKGPNESNINERKNQMRMEKKPHTHIFYRLVHINTNTNTNSTAQPKKLENEEKNWRKMGIKLFYDFVREQHIAILWTHLWFMKTRRKWFAWIGQKPNGIWLELKKIEKPPTERKSEKGKCVKWERERERGRGTKREKNNIS